MDVRGLQPRIGSLLPFSVLLSPLRQRPAVPFPPPPCFVSDHSSPFLSHNAQTTLERSSLYVPVPGASLTATDQSRFGLRTLIIEDSLQLVEMTQRNSIAGDWSCK